jgi:hypothetical protein
VKPRITEAEIRAAITADDALALHRSICEGLEENKDSRMDRLVDNLVGVEHPLRSGKFKDWDKVILAKAEKEWPVGLSDFRLLQRRRDSSLQRPQITRCAVRWWLELLFPELKPQPGDDQVPPEEERNWNPRSSTDIDLNKALEAYAMKVAIDRYTRLLGPAKVTDVSHEGGALDLLLHAPGGNLRVEVKGRRRPSADKVEVTWREVQRSQKEETCILFVVDSIDVDADYECSGGWWREYPDWCVHEGDADLKATVYLYTLGTPAECGQVEAT